MIDRPILELIETADAGERETAAEIAARCRTVERACRAIGFPPGCQYERVAALVARVAGFGSLRRTVSEIAADTSIDCTAEHVARAVAELTREHVLTCDIEQAAPTRRRGRPPKVYRLAIDWDAVRSVVAEYEAWRRDRDAAAPVLTTAQSPAAAPRDFPTSTQHAPDIVPTSGQHSADIGPTFNQHPASHTVSIPLTHFSPPPPPPTPSPEPEAEPIQTAAAAEVSQVEKQPEAKQPPTQPQADKPPTWGDAAEAVRAAGVAYVTRCVQKAKANGYTPAELIDDAYVLEHCPKIGPGALLAKVAAADRCWPASGIPSADELRGRRGEQAARVRAAVARDAPPNTHRDIVVAVTVRRLRASALADQITAGEQSTFDRLEQSKQQAQTPEPTACPQN